MARGNGVYGPTRVCEVVGGRTRRRHRLDPQPDVDRARALVWLCSSVWQTGWGRGHGGDRGWIPEERVNYVKDGAKAMDGIFPGSAA
ncbi:hypothetical protein ACFQ1S_43760 [Kibdelosporangium lantanae]|uniref:Uncharacterized protein n=1 Tax=Kibdelosporangium lantanae TaxID=1497396 RepID=A0ABW3MRM7_9PSEU